ncbi:hypothetical protein [Hymenobacter canadensis]|uniref:Uncharacterized protein n=1 Tax=Hymenobacter canadensis TaxID=2999067 RepID=A0ABY7LW81_9BACT|nr:hypothetical protein [Hymenobacter canadensis]WBA43178.1 hypothetical protein O3303_06335 [Hymenobacter canadensis]
MEEKYAWAEASWRIIEYEALHIKPSTDPDRRGTDEVKLKHAVWSFLQAYQQIRFYHGRWQKENGINNLATKYIDRWRADFLTPEQSYVWGLLNQIRTQDTHDEPLLPTVHVLVRVRGQNGRARAINGKFLVELNRTKTIEVKVVERYYELTNLIITGLACMRLFIDSFDQVSRPLMDGLPESHRVFD